MSITLSSLTTTIIAEVPTLFEDVMNQEISNSVMLDHCSELKNRIELTKESIENEREKQRQLRNHLLKIRGPITMSSRSISLGSVRSTQSSRSTDAEDRDSGVGLESFLSEGSPVSLRSKRKGVVFDDNMRIVKRARHSRAN